MKLFLSFILLLTVQAVVAQSPILGRWDLTVDYGNKKDPGWLEVRPSGGGFVGYYLTRNGSARPVSKVNFTNNKISFTVPKQYEDGMGDVVFEGTLSGEELSGVITNPDGKKLPFKGVRAPMLTRSAAPVWGEPIKLFNGKDLSGWHADREQNQWVAENGVLRNPKSGANLITNEKFDDFKLHIEFKYPENGNSGIYLRGRYELQVEDSKYKWPVPVEFGGIYGHITPSQRVSKGPGEWQTYDITLVGRHITVVANGVTIICNQEIPGITGGAIDSHEGEPGPIMLQGDHTTVEYRNIVITRAVSK